MRLTSENTSPGLHSALGRAGQVGIPWLLTIGAAGLGVWMIVGGRPGGWLLLMFAVGVFGLTAVLLTLLSTTSADRRVTIDEDRREIVFENHPVMRGFWPTRPEPRYVCGFDDLAGVERARGRGTDWLLVHVPGGRIRINSHSTHFGELEALLRRIAGPRRIPVTRRHYIPALVGGLLVFAALFLALAMGWLP